MYRIRLPLIVLGQLSRDVGSWSVILSRDRSSSKLTNMFSGSGSNEILMTK